MTPNNEAKVTERPWTVDTLGYLRGPNGENVLEVKDNAEFVARVVNAYDAYREACEFVVSLARSWPLDGVDEHTAYEMAKEALAEGRPE